MTQGWSVLTVAWADQPANVEQARRVYNQVLRQMVDDHPGATHLVIAKSIGSLALPAALEDQVPGIWLTPLVSREWPDPAVRNAAVTMGPHSPPTLFAGGTADAAWDRTVPSPVARIFEARGADHSLEVPGDWRATLVVLNQLMEVIETMVQQIGGGARGANPIG